jgi:hypothetical protein
MNLVQLRGAGSRRDFFRHAALGGIFGLMGTLIARSTGQTCVNDGLCRGCTAYDDCELPRALSVKQSRATDPR